MKTIHEGAIEALCKGWNDICVERAQGNGVDALDHWMTRALLGDLARAEFIALGLRAQRSEDIVSSTDLIWLLSEVRRAKFSPAGWVLAAERIQRRLDLRAAPSPRSTLEGKETT